MKASEPAALWHKYSRQYLRRAAPAVRKAARSAARFTAHSSVPSVFFISSFLIARYLPNSDFSYPSEIILPITLFAVLATGIFYMYRWVFRRTFPGKTILAASLPAHIASFLLLYALYGFNYAFPTIQKAANAVLPPSFTTSLSSALTRITLLGLIFGVIAYGVAWIFHRLKTLRSLQPLKLVVFIACFIFAWQGAKMGIRLWEIRHQLSYAYTTQLPAKPNQASSQTASPDSSDDLPSTTPKPAKPNVYYLLFDRYASSSTLKTVYNYDNSAFTSFLTQEGFVTRQPAYANYPFTTQSVASTFSMGYLNNLEKQFKTDAGSFQANFPYRQIINNSPAAQIFKQNGYQYNHVSSWWDVTRNGIKADTEPAKSYRLRVLGLEFWLTDLQRDIMNRSAFLPLLVKGITVGSTPILKYDLDRNPGQNFNDQMQAIKDIAAQSSRQQKPNFTFAHFLSPHDPYVFNEDGSSAAYSSDRNDDGADEYVKYTNQLAYVTKRIQSLIDYIRTNDPTAVIIFQPDEGPYPKEFRGQLTAANHFDPKNLQSDESLHQKLGITASYFMPGVDPAIVQRDLTGNVNVFPFVLNHYLGYAIPYLPECNFSAGNKFVLYNFTLLSGRLNHTADPEVCKQYE